MAGRSAGYSSFKMIIMRQSRRRCPRVRTKEIKWAAARPTPDEWNRTQQHASGPSAFEPSANAATGTSVIGTDLTILGDHITIISKNKLQVDGDVRGNVHGKQVSSPRKDRSSGWCPLRPSKYVVAFAAAYGL